MRGRWPSLSTSPPHPSCSSSSSCCYHRSSRPPATAASTAPGPPTTPPRSPSPVRAFPSTAADRPTSPCFFASSYGSVALILTGVRLRRRFMRVRRRGGVHGRRLPRRRGPRAVPGRRRLRRLLPGRLLLLSPQSPQFLRRVLVRIRNNQARGSIAAHCRCGAGTASSAAPPAPRWW